MPVVSVSDVVPPAGVVPRKVKRGCANPGHGVGFALVDVLVFVRDDLEHGVVAVFPCVLGQFGGSQKSRLRDVLNGVPASITVSDVVPKVLFPIDIKSFFALADPMHLACLVVVDVHVQRNHEPGVIAVNVVLHVRHYRS